MAKYSSIVDRRVYAIGNSKYKNETFKLVFKSDNWPCARTIQTSLAKNYKQ